MNTVTYNNIIASILGNVSANTDFTIAIGNTSTNSATIGDTDLDNEIERNTSDIEYSNSTLKISTIFYGSSANIDGEDIKETGVFDSTSSGTTIARTTGFTPITGDSNYLYFIEQYSEITQDNNTARLKVTDKCISNIYDNILGTGSDYPTHFAFGTHLRLDQFNATTGWTPTGGSLTTNALKQEGTASIDIRKTTTSSTSMSMTRTLASAVDFSDVTTVRLWSRINTSTTLGLLASSNCFTLRIGSDSSNYKQIQLDRSDFSTVWVLHELSIADFSDTGSPDMENLDYLYIEFTTTNATDVWAAGEVLLDMLCGTWDLSDTDNTLHDEVYRASYSTVTIDETKLRYTGVLGTSNGNTYNYYYIGMFDDSSAGDMYIINTLYLTSKDSTKQINVFIDIGVRFYD